MNKPKNRHRNLRSLMREDSADFNPVPARQPAPDVSAPVGALKATDVTRAPGVKLVLPEKATPEMEAAAERYWQARRFNWFLDDPRTWAGVYKAMTDRAVVEGQAGVIFPERKAEPVAREPQTNLNPADRLPPVACPLLIEVDGALVKAERTEFVQHRGQDMVYRLADGSTLLGRFRWTYP